MRNLRLAARMLWKAPFVTAIAVLSLALGIGANAAIFSLFDQLLLRPLPVREPSRLVNLSAPGPAPGSNSCNDAGSCEEVFSYAMFRDLQKSQVPFTDIAAHRSFGVSLGYRNEPMTGDGMMVSGSYFPVLGLTAAKGRLLGPDDDRVVGGSYVAVIGYAFWQSRLGGDPGVVGTPITINGKPYTIVGVAPKGFDGTTVTVRPMVYVPITMRGELQHFTQWENRQSYWVYLFARLKPGVSREAAEQSINGPYHGIINDVEAPLQKQMSDRTMEKFRAKKVLLADGARGQSSVHREAKTPLLLLFAVTGMVLLIACANIANLLLARGAARSTEMGVRLALGGTRRNLVMQLLTESLLLAALGGIASLIVAQWTLSAIGMMIKPDAAQVIELRIGWPVAIFAAVLSMATGLAFGLFPALHSTRTDLISTIRAGAGQITGGGRAAARFRSGLVTAQIALSMALLIMSALFLRSLVNVSHVNLGVKVDHVATFEIVPQRTGYDSVRSAHLFERVEEELAALPGVTGVSDGMVPLLAGDNWGNSVHVQGFDCAPDVDCDARYNEIGTDYFRTLGVRVLAGREFTTADHLGATRVAIVNEEFTRKFGLGKDAVGKFIGDDDDDSLNIQIVGVVPDVKYSQVKDSIPAVYYRPWRQDARLGALNFYVRSSTPPEQMLATLRETMKRIDPQLPVEELKTMPQAVKENVFLDRMISVLSSAFALLATLLAGIGLYGVLSYSVMQRTREIGVRMALGADASLVRRLVLRQVGVMLLVGGGIGVGAALALGRAARSLLFELQGHDPAAVIAAITLLALVALAAGIIPARRAAMVNPMNALRYD
ncbi:MAG TPA: ABC transporter permease [Gemmatimonadaceae bacterium]|nr:ABC transporter permease [Gemmatimonadaceae bacterium]